MNVENCYVCAHRGSNVFGSALPSGSPAGPTDMLGVCYSCFVLACSEHANRPGQYQCVICQHKAAVIFASSPSTTGNTASGPMANLRAASAAGAAAAAESFVRATDASQGALETMGRALARLQDDAEQTSRQPRFVAPDAARSRSSDIEQPNIFTDLPSVVARQQRRQDLRPDIPNAFGGMSLQAIAAAAHGTLFPPGSETSFGPGSEQVVLGALLGALSLADDQPATVGRLPAPWAVAHPGLLDPVMWVIGVAYISASAENRPA